MQKSFLVLGILYLCIRFGFTQKLDEMGTYASYIFEVICLTIAAGLYGKKFLELFKTKKSVVPLVLVSIVAGFLAYKGATVFGLVIPFDFNNKEGIIFLLVVAPILEELIFRFMLWQPIKNISDSQTLTWMTTSIVFSYSHFHAFWFVPAELYGFVYYQTAYTLFLGLLCGYSMFRNSSLLDSILIHFVFNLGFYLAFLSQ